MTTAPHTRTGGTTRRTVELALALDLRVLPDAVNAAITDVMRDGFGLLVAGLQHPNIAILLKHVEELGSRRQLRIPTTPVHASVLEAAFVCGSAIHAVDFEPMFDPPTHAVSPVLGALVPLLLAGADTTGSAQRWRAAFAAGIQLQADLRTAARDADAVASRMGNHFPFQRVGFHPPGTVGVLGAALASARWLGLDADQTATALGIAASRAGALAANIGTMTKATHCGHAARAGLESAMLAARGLTACVDVLEAPSGWGEVFVGEGLMLERIVRGMEQVDCFTHPGFAFKRWPAHTAMQVAIHTALGLHRAGHIPGRVTITAPVLPYCNRPDPRDPDEARFSFQANTALALLDGHIDDHSYTHQSLERDSVRALLSRTTLVADPSRTAAFPSLTLHIALDDGRSADGDRWPGHWKSPATRAELHQKFSACTIPVLGVAGSRALSAAIDDLEHADGVEALQNALLRRRARARTASPPTSVGPNQRHAPPLSLRAPVG